MSRGPLLVYRKLVLHWKCTRDFWRAPSYNNNKRAGRNYIARQHFPARQPHAGLYRAVADPVELYNMQVGFN